MILGYATRSREVYLHEIFIRFSFIWYDIIPRCLRTSEKMICIEIESWLTRKSSSSIVQTRKSKSVLPSHATSDWILGKGSNLMDHNLQGRIHELGGSAKVLWIYGRLRRTLRGHIDWSCQSLKALLTVPTFRNFTNADLEPIKCSDVGMFLRLLRGVDAWF